MGYSFTEKKRLRYNFRKGPFNFPISNLLELQLSPYHQLLQRDVKPDQRQNIGLQAVFNSVFPMVSSSGMAALEFVSYQINEPEYSVKSCKLRSLTYAIPINVKLRFVLYRKKSGSEKLVIQKVKEQEVFFGSIPMMTDDGVFIINGTERVVVSQLHRAPGVIFTHDKGRTHSSGKLLFSARVIPYRGSWLDFEFDHHDVLYARIDRRRKILATIFLKAMGMDAEEILSTFYPVCSVSIDGEQVTLDSLLVDVFNSELLSDVIIEGKQFAKKGDCINDLSPLKDKKNIQLSINHLVNQVLCVAVVHPKTGEILLPANHVLKLEDIVELKKNKVKEIQLINVDRNKHGSYISETLRGESIQSESEARLEIYKVIRPGEPSSKQTANSLFENFFFNNIRYDLSPVGRMKINHRFGSSEQKGPLFLETDDITQVLKILINIRDGLDEVDDVDALTNRRIRSINEMVENQCRIALARLEKTIKDRLSIAAEIETLTPKDLFHARPLSSAMRDFFGLSQLSQFMDQVNILSRLTHKRRISALGPGGLTRERAGFEVRDVHPSHYGRLCPIETPEGPNIGLINTIAIYAKVNQFGFLETPYYKVQDGRILTDKAYYLSAINEGNLVIAQADVEIDKTGLILNDSVLCRYKNEFIVFKPKQVDYIDVSSRQIASVAASLIPFLPNDDANRALMGSNMQRQAVPTLIPEAPLVGTGMESTVIAHSCSAITAKNSGTVVDVDGLSIVILQDEVVEKIDFLKGDDQTFLDVYELAKYERSNQSTCVNQTPLVKVGDRVRKGDVIADGSSLDNGELALGKNLLVAFMSWHGYNFEDSILISERLYKEDVLTSIHIEEITGCTRDTRLGHEEITADVPGVSEASLSTLDATGVVYVGAHVKKRDILIGKVSPKGDDFVSPEEKLLYAIFGEKASNVKDTSVYATYSGCVTDVQIFSHTKLKEDTASDRNKELYGVNKTLTSEFFFYKKELINRLYQSLMKDGVEIKSASQFSKKGLTKDQLFHMSLGNLSQISTNRKAVNQMIHLVIELLKNKKQKIDKMKSDFQKRLKTSDQLPPGVLKMVKVYIAVKRKIQPGDKMSGRHGNKGVVSKICPVEDMPHLKDGQPVDIVLNPLGVPSRMNVGQILETHLGWAAKKLGEDIQKMLNEKKSIKELKTFISQIYNTSKQPIDWNEFDDDQVLELAKNLSNGVPMASPVFDGAKEEDIKKMMRLATLPESGQINLYDGLTGEKFDRPVTIGYIYMLRLNHLIDDKVHARSTGPYSLVTQQPLGGKAQLGGQRFGEMEVWALEAYGAAHILQEILTVKSDDSYGRSKVYKNIIDGIYFTQPRIPESFRVLMKELNALGLDLILE